MRGILLFIIVSSIFHFACSSTPKFNCQKLIHGKFYYFTKKTREKILVERTGNTQIETDTTNSWIMKSKVDWTDNCKYDMYMNSLSDSTLDTFDSLVAATPSHVEITFVGDTFYVCLAEIEILNEVHSVIDTLYFSK